MNIKGIQSYCLALGYLCEYEQEYPLQNELKEIKFNLALITRNYVRKNKLDLAKLIKRADDKLQEVINHQKVEASILTFVLHLIIKNPLHSKYKVLTNLAVKLNKEHIFSKDELISTSKGIVNKYYAIQQKGNK